MLKRTHIAVVAGGLGCFALGAMMFAGERPPVTEAVPSGGAVLIAFDDKAEKADKAGVKEPAKGAPDAAWIGLMLEEGKDKGLRVSAVFPGGPAAFAGVRAGDVLVKVGDAAPASAAAAAEAIEKLPPQKEATLTVRRGDATLDLKVNPGSLADFHDRYVREMLRRDPRDPKFTHQHGVSEADMQVELVRRLFEQNQRLETTLHQVLTELQALRAEVRGKK